ncbi:MAG: hypothetical protein FWE28_05340 [Oscillospiraceae bacterium]|nr:hypothetical protein [Oscillospiraceae bacterium]
MNTNNESSKFIPTPHFIAYLDILGYKEKANGGDIKLAETIDSTLDSAKDFAKWFLGRDDEDLGIAIKAFSDNILICTEKGWDLLFLMVGVLQHHMLDNGYFIRGALCHSDLYFDERFLFGKGIIMAHEIESKIARFPRIILHSSYRSAANAQDDPRFDPRDDEAINIFDVFSSVAGMLPLYLHDTDGYMFINYLGISHAMPDYAKEHKFEEVLESHRDKILFNIKDCERRCLPQGIMEKFLWCLQYHNRFCSENDYKKHMLS